MDSEERAQQQPSTIKKGDGAILFLRLGETTDRTRKGAYRDSLKGSQLIVKPFPVEYRLSIPQMKEPPQGEKQRAAVGGRNLVGPQTGKTWGEKGFSLAKNPHCRHGQLNPRNVCGEPTVTTLDETGKIGGDPPTLRGGDPR